MKLKIVDGKVILEDGHPVYIYEDGTESPFDAKTTLAGLKTKNKALEDEKERHFKTAKKAKEDLKPFKDIDPEKYKEAMKKFSLIDDSKLVDEQGVEALKKSMRAIFDEEKATDKKSYKSSMDEASKENKDLRSVIYDLAIKNKFATDKHFSGEKPLTIYPAEDAAKIFGANFETKIKDGELEIIAKHNDGKPILSKKNHGDPAEFGEAITQLVATHAKSNAILRNAKTGGPVTVSNINPDTGKPLDGATGTERITAGLKKEYGSRYQQ
jgi:hypothetical protein